MAMPPGHPSLPLALSNPSADSGHANAPVKDMELFRRQMAEVQATEAKGEGNAATKETPRDWTAANTMTMSGGVLVYSLIVLTVASIVVRTSKTPEIALRLFSTVLIITSAVFLVVAGYSSQQIAPAFGLLGTMAGYVLGKAQSGNKGPEDPPK